MISLALACLVASPVDQLGFGSAGAGLASAAVAEPPGAAAAFHNPALAATRAESEAAIGYSYSSLRFAVNGAAQRLDPGRALTLGLVWPISLGEHGALGVAGALSLPDLRILRARVVPPDRPRFLLFDNRLQRLGVDGALAYARRVGGLELAGAIGISVLTGVTGQGATFTLVRSGAEEQAEAAVEVQLPAVATPSAALALRAGRWSVGLTARGPLAFDMAIGTTADIRFGPLRGDISSAMISTDFYTPLKLALGAAVRFGATTGHAALELHRWSAAPPLTATWVSHVDFEGLEIALPQGAPARQRLRDAFTPRLGVEHAWTFAAVTLCGRAGAFYERSPVAARRATVFLDSDHLGGALGLGVTSNGPLGPFVAPLSLDLHVQGLWLVPRTFRDADPTALYGPLRITGLLLSSGATLTLRF